MGGIAYVRQPWDRERFRRAFEVGVDGFSFDAASLRGYAIDGRGSRRVEVDWASLPVSLSTVNTRGWSPTSRRLHSLSLESSPREDDPALDLRPLLALPSLAHAVITGRSVIGRDELDRHIADGRARRREAPSLRRPRRTADGP
ncbi:hypothetical protein [Cellulomonas endophytica]|uniref:hypothetical protein n=1 Tax=Cellulomonas endophytica TaxID=2494735 RepID=UPI0010102A6D|nr:hypothetical protein [Cellulomonas endophytica]